MEELITIIVPLYNVENCIKKCLESIINQTYKNLEIILIDDGSIDSSGQICDEYKEKDSRIKVIHKTNEGSSKARNIGIDLAKGKYIGFVDSDDYIEINMYEKLYKIITDEKADIAFCGYSKINELEKITPKPLDIKKFPKDKTVIYDIIGTIPTDDNDISMDMSVWKCLYKSQIIQKNNIKFRAEYIAEDIIFQIEYFEYVKKVALIADTLYNYRYNSESISRKYRKDRLEKQKELYIKEKKMIEQKGYLKEEVLNRLKRTFIMKIKSCIKLEVLANREEKKIRIRNIENIVNDELVNTVVNSYPIQQLPIKNRILTYLIKYKMSRILFIIYKIKKTL